MSEGTEGFDDVMEAAFAEGEAAVLEEVGADEGDVSTKEVVDVSGAGDVSEESGTTPASTEDINKAEQTISDAGFEKTAEGLYRFKASGEMVELDENKLVSWARRYEAAVKGENKLREERDSFAEAAKEAEALKELTKQNDELLKAILRGGAESDQLLKEMRQAFADPNTTSSEEPRKVDKTGPTQDEMAMAGQQVVQDVIMPYAQQVAEAFEGADAAEVRDAILTMLDEEVGVKKDLSWDDLEDVMNRRIIEEMEGAGYDRTGDLNRFDSTPHRDVGDGSGGNAEARTARGITKKGFKKVDEAAALKAENERLKAELQEKATGSTPEIEGGFSGGSGSRKNQAEAKSELLDLSEARSVRDIMDELDKMERKAYNG